MVADSDADPDLPQSALRQKHARPAGVEEKNCINCVVHLLPGRAAAATVGSVRRASVTE
ncbi:MAG: hypothetical protein SFV23_09220 [Planctomycetaceae bacterium]|nr:hypothetical protein [Planctomycetaceae bacterium]